MGSIASPILVHDHQVTTSLWSLLLSGILTSAHTNKIDDHRNGENHTQTYKQVKG